MYCVYLTSYMGNLLPPFYIGSSSIKKIELGYKGSVTSKRYKTTFYKELQENPHLFKTKIISYHKTRKSALHKENELQRKLDVVSSCMYFNESFASANGYFGYNNSGEQNGFYGKRHSDQTLERLRKPKLNIANYKKPKSESHKKNISKNNAMHHQKNRDKISKSLTGRKYLYKDGMQRRVQPGTDLWVALIEDGYSLKP